ncbi:PREDICTED: uncharacterized protein LOC103332224 [Prunus mume]|uniref:Uncharacterized protein LOC103332224 n=1 Tax=Prunus mume TaxID=102107 RepID=A0ABM0P1R8_PRUMU|nr:PREDICTED: uncharacterized protein LOC103332224 [Prunus mume]
MVKKEIVELKQDLVRLLEKESSESRSQSGADLNCIQEGLIPTKYYQKSKESLSTASGKSLQLNYEIPKAHVDYDGVISTYLGEQVKFEFLSKPEIHNLRALQKQFVSKSIQEEQEELLIDLISRVENPELKSEYLKKLRKVISQESPSSSIPQPIILNTTLEKFNRKKEVTLQDLQLEVKMVKKEIVELKQDLVRLLEKESSESRSQSGADLNCIQEGLIPTKYYQKSKESLSTASGKSLQLNYEIPKAHVDYDGVISTYLGEQVKFEFLSKPEIHNLRALQKQFVSKSIQVIRKVKQLNFLKEEIKFKRVEQQLSNESLQLQIQQFENKLKNEICSDLPNAFWYRKQHVVNLPYIKTFSEKNIPTKARPIQMSQEIMEFCKKEIHELLQKKMIRKSKSPWSCPAFYVQKNAELERGVPILVINYKPLNSVLEWIRYPIPNKRDLINRLEKSVVYSKFDMKSGFWQIQIDESDRYKTAFVTPFGHYEWNVMPFGLKNAPSEFQNIMNKIFNPYSHFSIVYIDDVLIFSESVKQHWKHLHKFLQIVKQNGLVVSAKKIKLFQTNIRFLGFNICQSQISPIDRVIQFADKFPDQILDKSQLQRFLRSLNYVSDFYQNLRKQCKPLFDRLQSNPPPWSNIHTEVVKQIKAHVKTLPCLGIPSVDFFKIVETDASDIGYGGILKQKACPNSP